MKMKPVKIFFADTLIGTVEIPDEAGSEFPIAVYVAVEGLTNVKPYSDQVDAIRLDIRPREIKK